MGAILQTKKDTLELVSVKIYSPHMTSRFALSVTVWL